MWGIGCVLAELFTGKQLFTAPDNFALLCEQIKLCGLPPVSVMKTRPHFFQNAKPPAKPPGADEKTAAIPAAFTTTALATVVTTAPEICETDNELDWTFRVSTVVPHSRSWPQVFAKRHRSSEDDASRLQLIDLVSRLVTIDPAARLTPTQALAHPFFTPLVVSKTVSKTPDGESKVLSTSDPKVNADPKVNNADPKVNDNDTPVIHINSAVLEGSASTISIPLSTIQSPLNEFMS
jgi:serine/threonine protein kinase